MVSERYNMQTESITESSIEDDLPKKRPPGLLDYLAYLLGGFCVGYAIAWLFFGKD